MPRRPWALLVPVFVFAAITAFAYAVVVLAIIRYLRRWILLRADRQLIAADEIPAPARERMIAIQGAFRALGFTDVGLIREKPRPDSEQFIAFLRSGSGTELAIVGAQVLPANTKVIIHTSVIIWSRLMSGPPAETTGLDQFGIREGSFAREAGSLLAEGVGSICQTAGHEASVEAILNAAANLRDRQYAQYLLNRDIARRATMVGAAGTAAKCAGKAVGVAGGALDLGEGVLTMAEGDVLQGLGETGGGICSIAINFTGPVGSGLGAAASFAGAALESHMAGLAKAENSRRHPGRCKSLKESLNHYTNKYEQAAAACTGGGSSSN